MGRTTFVIVSHNGATRVRLSRKSQKTTHASLVGDMDPLLFRTPEKGRIGASALRVKVEGTFFRSRRVVTYKLRFRRNFNGGI